MPLDPANSSPSGSDGQAVGLSGIRQEFLDRSFQVDPKNLVRRGFDEEDLALGVAQVAPRGSWRPEATGLPGLIGKDDVADPRGARTSLHRLGPAFPEIAHRLAIVVVVARDVTAVDDPEEVVIPENFRALSISWSSRNQSPAQFSMSRMPVVRNARIGFASNFRTRVGNS